MPIAITLLVMLLIVTGLILLQKKWKIAQSFFTPSSEWKSNNQEFAIDMIIEDIKRAKERILLYGGNGNTYNNKKILDVLEETEIPIEMIFQNPQIGSTELAKLVKNKANMFLGFVNKEDIKHFGVVKHFRVIDYDYVYIEKEHKPESSDREYKRLFQMRFLPGKYFDNFFKIKSFSEAVQ